MQTVKVILFDLDDTLIHFDDYWKESLLETIRRHPATMEYVPELLFSVIWEMNQVLEVLLHQGQISLRQFWNDRLIQALSRFHQEIDEETADNFNALHMAISKNYMKASPELLELLTELKKTYALGIVTNGSSRWQRDKVQALGIQSLFAEQSILISDEIGFEKPSPEIYEKALRHFDVKPEEVVFVGDSWNNDVEGPMKLGMKSIWFNKKAEAVPEGSALFGVIHDIRELRNLL